MTENSVFNYEGLAVADFNSDQNFEDIVTNCPVNIKDEEKDYIKSSYEAGFYRYCLEYIYKKSMALLRKVLYSAGETIANKMAYVMDQGSILGISDVFALSLANKFGIIDREDRMNIIKLAELLQAQNRKLNVGQITKEQVENYGKLCFNYIFYKDYSAFSESYKSLVDMLTNDKLMPLTSEYITILEATNDEKTIVTRLLFVLLFEVKKKDEVFINNFKLLIPALWENLPMSDKIFLSLYIKQNNNTELAEEVLNEVSNHIKIPDFNTDVNLIKHIFINGQDAIASHFSLNNTRSEISALLNIKDNLHIPAMFTRNYICPTILAYIGNPYGYLDEARNVAKEILADIPNDKWIFFFKNYFFDAHIMIKLFYSQKTAQAWCDLVKEYIGEIEEEIPNEDIKNILTMSKANDVDGVRKLCKSLYLK